MNKQLLIATLSAAFSGITFAQDTPEFNHTEKLQWFIKYGETASNCPHIASELPALKAIMNNLQQRDSENGAIGFTSEEKSYIESLDAQYNQHHRVTIDELVSGNTQQEETQEDDKKEADQQ